MLFESTSSLVPNQHQPWPVWLLPGLVLTLGAIGLVVVAVRLPIDFHLGWQVRAAGLFWAQRRMHEIGQIGHFLLQCNPRWFWGGWRRTR